MPLLSLEEASTSVPSPHPDISLEQFDYFDANHIQISGEISAPKPPAFLSHLVPHTFPYSFAKNGQLGELPFPKSLRLFLEKKGKEAKVFVESREEFSTVFQDEKGKKVKATGSGVTLQSEEGELINQRFILTEGQGALIENFFTYPTAVALVDGHFRAALQANPEVQSFTLVCERRGMKVKTEDMVYDREKNTFDVGKGILRVLCQLEYRLK